MRSKIVGIGALAILMAWGALAWSQEAAPAEPPAASEPAASEPAAEPAAETAPAADPAAAGEFDGLFKQWKELLAKMRQTAQDYKIAKPADQPAIKEAFDKMVVEGEALQPKLMVAAEAKYAANPNEDDELTKFLAQLVRVDISRGNYVDGLRRAKLLLDNKFPNPILKDLAGTAAFGAGDYDAAEEYFKAAKAAKIASPDVDAYLAEIPVRKKEAEADDLPRVKLTTERGDIVLELFENEAPIAVTNFIDLVEKKFYDGLTFHRVIDGFVAQGGDPVGDGSGGPGYNIPCECAQDNHRLHFPGSLSMAHAGANTGGSQFFLTFGRTSNLDGKHTVFGRVIEGADVLPKIKRREAVAGAPPADKILKAEVLRKRDHEYDIKKLLAERESGSDEKEAATEQPVDAAPADKAPADEAPAADETPVDEAPADEAAADEEPAEAAAE